MLIEHGADLILEQEFILPSVARRSSVPVLEYLLAQDGAKINPPNQMSSLGASILEYSRIAANSEELPDDKEEQLHRLRANAQWLLSQGGDINHRIGSIPWWYPYLEGRYAEGIRLVAEMGKTTDDISKGIHNM